MDIHVCRDKEELDRLVFFNSYGDLGMIMGLVASNIGLKLSSKGLFVSIHRTTMYDFSPTQRAAYSVPINLSPR